MAEIRKIKVGDRCHHIALENDRGIVTAILGESIEISWIDSPIYGNGRSRSSHPECNIVIELSIVDTPYVPIADPDYEILAAIGSQMEDK